MGSMTWRLWRLVLGHDDQCPKRVCRSSIVVPDIRAQDTVLLTTIGLRGWTKDETDPGTRPATRNIVEPVRRLYNEKEPLQDIRQVMLTWLRTMRKCAEHV